MDDCSTIGHGLDRLGGPLLDADGCWRLVSIGTGTPTLIDPAPTPSELIPTFTDHKGYVRHYSERDRHPKREFDSDSDYR